MSEFVKQLHEIERRLECVEDTLWLVVHGGRGGCKRQSKTAAPGGLPMVG